MLWNKMLQINHLDKTIGYVNEHNQFISRRTKEHFFVKYKGFGLSLGIVLKLRNMYVNEVIILFVRGDGTTSKYKTNIDNFLKHGITYKNLEEDYQKILPLTYFESDQYGNERDKKHNRKQCNRTKTI